MQSLSLNRQCALPVFFLSMHDCFEFLFRDRFEPAALDGLSKLYDLCSGRHFSVTYETDPDFVKELARVCICEDLILAF
jgi:hypothetical protein